MRLAELHRGSPPTDHHDGFATEIFLARLYNSGCNSISAADLALIERLIKKFEVLGRLAVAYSADLSKPAIREQVHLHYYAFFTAILLKQAHDQHDLKALNTALKLIDSLRTRWPPEVHATLKLQAKHALSKASL